MLSPLFLLASLACASSVSGSSWAKAPTAAREARAVPLAADSQVAEVDPAKDIQSLLEAEKGYAKLAADRGFRAASLSVLSDDAVIFTPSAVNGKKFWQESKEDLVISWRPSFASIAASSELGYTTGPSEYRKARNDKEPEGFGHFVSVWRKTPKGDWKVVLDVGINHPQPPAMPAEVTTQLPRTAGSAPESARGSLDKTQREFAEALKKNEADAIIDNASDDIRLYRRGSMPAVGKGAAKKLLTGKAKTSLKPLGGGTSTAVDLAYEYGEYNSQHDETQDRGIYFCIWRLGAENEWKLVLELQKTFPPEKP